MSQEIVLFHSALGLRPAVTKFAERLRAAGYVVHTPDLFDGAVFDSLEAGAAKQQSLGIPELMRRAEAAVADLPDGLVYAGFSMGAAAAEYLAATRAGAKAAVLMSGALNPAKAGIAAWPRGVLVQVHYAKDDPQVPLSEIDALAAAVRAAGLPIHIYSYSKGGHLFADENLADFSRESSWLMMERILELLARLDFGERPTAEMPVTDRAVARPRAVAGDEILANPRVEATISNDREREDERRRTITG